MFAGDYLYIFCKKYCMDPLPTRQRHLGPKEDICDTVFMVNSSYGESLSPLEDDSGSLTLGFPLGHAG